MFQRIIHKLFKSRHFWRDADFSEIGQLYASRVLRMLALNVVGGFASVYLYQNGYSLTFIALYWASFYGLKVILAYPAGRLVAHFGPKHGVLIGNALSIPSMVAITMVPLYGFTAIAAWGAFAATSSIIYNLGYWVDFSKVKHNDYAGREIGFMSILEKLAIGIGPLVGGGIALIGGPEASMITSAAFYTLAAAPLLRTGEPLRIRQRLHFSRLPWRSVWRAFRAEIGIGFEVFTTVTLWPLFVAITVIGVTGNSTYAILGALSSLTLLSSLVFAHVFGKLIDKRRGAELLRYSIVGKIIIHILRPFTTSLAGVGAINVTGEVAATGQQMSFMRGMFDMADNISHRVTFFTVREGATNIGACIGALALFFLLLFFGDNQAMGAQFYLAAVAALLIGMARFKIYRR